MNISQIQLGSGMVVVAYRNLGDLIEKLDDMHHELILVLDKLEKENYSDFADKAPIISNYLKNL